jgi:hypothetical protein
LSNAHLFKVKYNICKDAEGRVRIYEASQQPAEVQGAAKVAMVLPGELRVLQFYLLTYFAPGMREADS